MKKFITLLAVTAIAAIVISCGKTWEIPISKDVVIKQIEKQFPIEKGSLLVVKISNPKVQFDGSRSKIIINLDTRVSAPMGIAARDGSISVESNVDYNPAKKAIVLKDPALRSIDIAGLDNEKAKQVKEIIVPQIGKALDGLTVYTFDQSSTVEKLASKHLAGFRITNDDLIIKIK
jgi:hypothetical protein